MSLSLDYGDLKSAISNSKKLADELDQYSNELCKKVQNELYSVKNGSSTALSNADYYVNQKIKKLQEKSRNATEISNKIDTLVNTAKRVDEDVKSTIEGNQKEFFNANPDLKPSDFKLAFTSFMCDLKDVPVLGSIVKWGEDGLSAGGELIRNLKYWYHCEGGKELVDIVVSAALAVLSVVALVCACVFTGGTVLAVIVGVAGVISAVIGLVNSVTNLITSSYAYDCALRNEHGQSKVYAGRDTLSDVLSKMDFDDKFWNNFSNGAAITIEITDTVCSVIQIADLAVTIKKSLNGKNLKKTFQAICKPRDSKGRFIKGKPSILNGAKTIMSRFDFKDFLLGDLNPSDLKKVQITKMFKSKESFRKNIKIIGEFSEGVSGLIGDLDSIRNGEMNWGEFAAKRVIGGLDTTLFPDRNARVPKGSKLSSGTAKPPKLLADTTALKKLHGLVINKTGLGKMIFSDVLKADFITNSFDLSGGIIGDVKGIYEMSSKSFGVSYGLPDVDGINVKSVDLDALYKRREYFASYSAAGVTVKAPSVGVTKVNVPNMPHVGSVAVKPVSYSHISSAEFVAQMHIPTQTIKGVQIPSFSVSLEQKYTGVLPCFEFRKNFSAINSFYEGRVPFTFLRNVPVAASAGGK